MLVQLQIKNYALIEELDVSLGSGMTVITGETGAGKSIIVGAISLILGQRAENRVLYDKNKKCIVEGVFDISAYNMQSFFKNNELTYEKECILRREITPKGKSRAFINDTPVNLNILKELGIMLTDIHSQAETHSLNTTAFRFKVLDAYSGSLKLFEEYKNAYRILQKKKNELHALQVMERGSSDADYLRFQLDELESVAPKEGEEEQLKEKLNKLKHTTGILDGIASALQVLDDDDTGAVQKTRKAILSLAKMRDYTEQGSKILERLESALLELEDIYSELELMQQDVELNPEDEDVLRERLDELFSLEHKHHVQSVQELLDVRRQIETKLKVLEDSAMTIRILEEKIAGMHSEVESIGKKLQKQRKQMIPAFEKKIKDILRDLNIENAGFKIQMDKREEAGLYGLDDIHFLFSANKGVQLEEVHKMASGGELSRLILAIRSQVAQLTALPTIIFDEIDSGVSGETAGKVASLMKNMAASMQLIVITHLPQIAGMGDHHLHVSKDNNAASVKTQIRSLNKEESLIEIARMLSGEEVTAAAIENARELAGRN